MSFAAPANRRRTEKSVGICAAAIALAFAPLALANDASPQSLMQAGHWKQVRALAQKMMQEQPNSALSYYWMAEAKQAFGDDAGALPLAEKAVALDRNNAAYHLCLSEIYGDMAEHAGLFKLMSLGRSFKAEADKAEALDPKNLDVHRICRAPTSIFACISRRSRRPETRRRLRRIGGLGRRSAKKGASPMLSRNYKLLCSCSPIFLSKERFEAVAVILSREGEA